MCAWVIGNWKQNPATIDEVNKLLETIFKQLTVNPITDCQLMVAPSHTHMAIANQQLMQLYKSKSDLSAITTLSLSAQDVSAHSADTGAFTGDCSAKQLLNAGASWSIIGHSERRLYHHEDNNILQQKIIHALQQGLGVILCVGETEAQRDNKQTHMVLQQQLSVIADILADQELDGKIKDNIRSYLMIAYEPVWAIGTGNIPKPEEVAQVHQFIRQQITDYLALLQKTPIIYGGSVNAQNASQFASIDEVDGALVGGASLQAESFLAIAQAFAQASS